jgi:DNA-binding transcriptional regulator YbjK
VKSRRTAIADAAIELLAEGGTRALTHRKVDRKLGISEGSTSAYYSTREALTIAAAERMVEEDLATLDALKPIAPDGADVVEIFASWVVEAGAPKRRNRTVARYVLYSETANNPRLARVIAESREPFVRAAGELLRLAGAERPDETVRAFGAFLIGLILTEEVMPTPLLRPGELEQSIRGFLSSC